MANIKFLSFDTLHDLYVNQRKTQNEISKILGVSLKTVQNYMNIHDIKGRNVNKEKSLLTRLNIDEERFKNTLKYKYIVLKQSINIISREFNVSSRIIRKYLMKFNIPLRNHKESNAVSNSGDQNPNWKGGKKKHSDGYIMICFPEYPNADSNGYVYEHRLVMEQHIGRLLSSEEHIHHINENKTDNKIENLQIVSRTEHARLHGKKE